MSSFTARIIRSTALVAAAGSLLSGCYLTSPLWSQEFSGPDAKIPIQAYALGANTNITFECAQASHGGLYPSFGTPVWNQIAVINSGTKPILDPKGSEIFPAGLSTKLPSACWRLDYNGVYYAAIRAKQPPSSVFDGLYLTYDAAGFACMGTANGASQSWTGSFSENCHKTYSNSDNKIPYVIIRAQS